jgi:hypothetical protein
VNFTKRQILLAYYAHKCRARAIIERTTPEYIALDEVPEHERTQALAILEEGLELLKQVNLIIGPRRTSNAPLLLGGNSLCVSAGWFEGKQCFRHIYLTPKKEALNENEARLSSRI